METLRTIVHASCVAVGPTAALIQGRSGSGKSALALELLARGAVLISDDRTILEARDGAVFASCPPAIRGRIEARGVGILAAATVHSAPVAIVVDLDHVEEDRHPPVRAVTLLGIEVPLLHSTVLGHFPAALLQYLKGGRSI